MRQRASRFIFLPLDGARSRLQLSLDGVQWMHIPSLMESVSLKRGRRIDRIREVEDEGVYGIAPRIPDDPLCLKMAVYFIIRRAR